MKSISRLHSWILCLAITCGAFLSAQGDDKSAGSRPKIYDTKADGAKQIADALATAKRENKHVLLQFGANWCGWCHKLHKLFETDKDIAAYLRENYLVVLVDVDKVDGKTHNEEINKRYGNPMRFGLPAIVILDSEGKQLTTQDTGKLEEGGDHHDPAKVMKFLKEWAPKRKSTSSDAAPAK